MSSLVPRARVTSRALLGAACAMLLIGAPSALAQGQTTGANGSATITVAPGSTGTTVTVNTGSTASPVPVSVSLTAGQTIPVVVTATPQTSISLLAGVSNAAAAPPNATGVTITVQSTTGQAIANTQVSVAVPPGTAVFAVVNGALIQLPVVNGRVTATTNANGQLNLVLGATLSAPVLVPAPQAPAQAPAPARIQQPVGLPKTGDGGASMPIGATLALVLATAGATGYSLRRGVRKAS